MSWPRLLWLNVRQAWQDVRAALLCRHRRLDVFEKRGFLLCHDCARVWRVRDRGLFTERWEARTWTRAEIIEVIQGVER